MPKASEIVIDTVHRKLLPVLVVLCVAACDLPTKSPDFTFTADVEAPLLFEKSFLFMGPDNSGNDALIDTTSSSFDSLFTVSSRSEEIYIIQEIDDFDVGEISDPIDPISFDPVDIEVSIGTLASPSFTGGVQQTVGIYQTPPLSAPAVPPTIESTQAFYPVGVGDLLVQPQNDVVDLTGSTILAYHFTSVASGFNELSFVLSNNLNEIVTDGSFVNGSIPQLVLEDADGTEITRTSFDIAPLPGQSATAVLNVASSSLPTGGRFRLDIGTPSGFQPIADAPQDIPVASTSAPLEYAGVTLDSLGPQSGVGDSTNDLVISGDIDFTGIVTQSGNVDIVITNNLDIPLFVDDVRLSNRNAVDTYPNGHVFAATFGQTVPARSTRTIALNLGVTGIASGISANVILSSSGSAGQLDVMSTDGVDFSVAGSAEINKVYFRPQGEQFSEVGQTSLSLDGVHFNSPTDFVEIASGSLDISNLVNGFDLAMDVVEISFPSIRMAPYAPSDSLRLRFQGSTDNPTSYIYRGIGRNEGPRNVSVDMASLRMYSDAGDLRYNIAATAEEATDVREIISDDQINSTVEANQIEVASVQATIDPIRFDVTEDADSNGLLDVLHSSESIESSLSGIGDLVDFGFTSLSLAGTELTLDISSSVSANYVLYAAIVGIDPDGNPVFLSGKNESAVSPSDTMSTKFAADGALLPAADLIRFNVSSGESQQASVVLNESNSNIDDFINGLPTSIRLAAAVIVEPDGGQVSLELPFTFDIGLGASIPLRFKGDAAFNKLVNADLSGLDELTDPEKIVSLDQATLRLGYENGIPLGLEARIRVVDESGNTIVTIPSLAEEPLTVESAASSEFGISSEATVGIGELTIDNETLVQMAAGSDIELVLSVMADQEGVRRVRAIDEIKVNLTGDFDLRVSTGN